MCRGRAGLLTPFVYYHFLTQRYNSRRNPYSRNMFHELRLLVESIAVKPGTPNLVRRILYMLVTFTSRLGPPTTPNEQWSAFWLTVIVNKWDKDADYRISVCWSNTVVLIIKEFLCTYWKEFNTSSDCLFTCPENVVR